MCKRDSDKLQQLPARLSMTMTEFLGQADAPSREPASPVVTARRSLTTDDNSIRITTPNYDYEYLCADLREKRMVPILTRIRAHNLAEFGEPVQHRGEEFIYVLEGSIEVHLQFYTTVTLKAGPVSYTHLTLPPYDLVKNSVDAVS